MWMSVSVHKVKCLPRPCLNNMKKANANRDFATVGIADGILKHSLICVKILDSAYLRVTFVHDKQRWTKERRRFMQYFQCFGDRIALIWAGNHVGYWNAVPMFVDSNETVQWPSKLICCTLNIHKLLIMKNNDFASKLCNTTRLFIITSWIQLNQFGLEFW